MVDKALLRFYSFHLLNNNWFLKVIAIFGIKFGL